MSDEATAEYFTNKRQAFAWLYKNSKLFLLDVQK